MSYIFDGSLATAYTRIFRPCSPMIPFLFRGIDVDSPPRSIGFFAIVRNFPLGNGDRWIRDN